MATKPTSPGGTFYNDSTSQDVDDFTYNSATISRDAFLFDESGIYDFTGGVNAPGDSADVVPVQVGDGFKLDRVQIDISNYQDYHQNSDIVVESGDGSYYRSFSVSSYLSSGITLTDELKAGYYNIYARNDAFDYSLTFDVSAEPVNQAPTSISLDDNSVSQSEGSSNVAVGTLAASDTGGDTHTYRLVTGAGDTDNGQFAISGTSLVAKDLHAMAPGDYSVLVRATDQGGLYLDKTFIITVIDDVAPQVASITAAPGAVAGTIDYTVTFDETVSGVSVDDFNLNTTGNASGVVNGVSGGGQAYTVNVGHLSGEGDLRLDLRGATDIVDTAGNAAGGYTTGSAYSVDTVSPTVTATRIALSGATGDNGTFKVGDTVTATWDNTVFGDNNSDISSATVDFGAFGGGSAITADNDGNGNWTATYTITTGSIDTANGNVSVTATDNANNTTTTAGITNASVDNVLPTITKANISLSGASGVDGSFKIGDTVTATWNSTASGDNNSDTLSGVSVDFSAFGGGSAVAASDDGSGLWTANYTITPGAIDAANLNASINVIDDAGNPTTAGTSNVSIDNVAPRVTDANISLSGASGANGTYRIGDTVTAAWNNTAGGDNNSDILSGVTVDFSAFGGDSAVAATNGSGVWTASCTITAGMIDATNVNVSVTATDDAGNITTTPDTTNASIDNVLPGILSGSLAVAEDSANGTLVGTITDGGNDGVTYSLVDDAGGRFRIDANSGALTVLDSTRIDYETSTSYDITVKATDNAGNGRDATLTVAVSDVNEVPTIDLDADGSSGAGGNEYAVAFSAGGAAVVIADADASLVEVDAGDQVESLTVTLTNRPDGDEVESLSLDSNAATAAATAGLIVSYVNTTGVLTITGPADNATYQTILKGIQYDNADAAINITTGNRIVEVVASDGSGNSLTAASTVSVVTAPVIDLGGEGGNGDSSASFSEGAGTALIAASATVIDPDGDNLQKLVIELTNALDGSQETITLSGGSGVRGSVTVSYDSNTQITLSGNDLAANYQSLLQELQYQNGSDDLDTAVRHITVKATDVNGNEGAAATLDIGVAAVNDAPTLTATGSDPTFTEDGTAVGLFTGASASTVEAGQRVSGLTLTVSNVTDAADERLSLDSTEIALTDGTYGATTANGIGYAVSLAGTTATVTLSGSLTTTAAEALIDGLSYRNAIDDPTTVGARTVTLTGVMDDGGTANGGVDAASLSIASSVTLSAVNDAPVFTTPTALNVAENATAVTMLGANDAESDTLLYSITGGADSALFSLDANSGALTFTGAPNFEAPKDQNTDNVYEVTVVASDGKAQTTQTLSITVTDVNETPSSTPSPIQVSRPDLLPNTPSGLPSVSETITNTGSVAGSAKLVENTGNANEVTATLPGGVSLVNQGARSASTVQQALADLLASINTQHPGNLNDQTGVASQWLSVRPDGTLLDIRTLMLNATGSASTSTPIQITGIANDGTSGVSHQEAFVIDTRGLPIGNQVQLDNIDFVSIIGATTLSGGDGANVVIADDAAQTIVLGADDDELHGGGGDDTVGSKGGDDLIYGEAGNDTLFGGAGADRLHGGSDTDRARYDGNFDDYIVIQDHSVITVQSKADPSDVDTLINVETLTFADGDQTVDYASDLNWLTGLYQQVLGRQADVDGIQYWARQLDAGVDAGDMALRFLDSAESGITLPAGDDSGTLDALYQGLLGRAADAAGKVYWQGRLESGTSLHDVAAGFMASSEMGTHDLTATEWSFIG